MIDIKIEIKRDFYFAQKEDIKKEIRLLLKDFGKDVRTTSVELSPKGKTKNLSQSITQNDIEDGTEITVGNDMVLYAKYNEPAEPEGYGVIMVRPMTRKPFVKVSVMQHLPVLIERIERMLKDKLITNC